MNQSDSLALSAALWIHHSERWAFFSTKPQIRTPHSDSCFDEFTSLWNRIHVWHYIIVLYYIYACVSITRAIFFILSWDMGSSPYLVHLPTPWEPLTEAVSYLNAVYFRPTQWEWMSMPSLARAHWWDVNATRAEKHPAVIHPLSDSRALY